MRRKKLTPELSEMKEKLAKVAKYITNYKVEIKLLQRDYAKVQTTTAKMALSGRLMECFKKIKKLSNDYRHMHIAYSELRGVKRTRIEGKTTRAEPLQEEEIVGFKKIYASK